MSATENHMSVTICGMGSTYITGTIVGLCIKPYHILDSTFAQPSASGNQPYT